MLYLLEAENARTLPPFLNVRAKIAVMANIPKIVAEKKDLAIESMEMRNLINPDAVIGAASLAMLHRYVGSTNCTPVGWNMMLMWDVGAEVRNV